MSTWSTCRIGARLTTAARSELLPDVPTVGEFVPGYEASAVAGIAVPKRTPTEQTAPGIKAALAECILKAAAEGQTSYD